MQDAYSQLKTVLDSQGLSAADLVRRIADQGDRINPKSVYRLADPEETLEKVDMRVIASICQALKVTIGDILTFEQPTIIEQFSAAKQGRMDVLMARHQGINGEALGEEELQELRKLVDEAETVARGNARRLANRKRRLQRTTNKPSRRPAGEKDS